MPQDSPVKAEEAASESKEAEKAPVAAETAEVTETEAEPMETEAEEATTTVVPTTAIETAETAEAMETEAKEAVTTDVAPTIAAETETTDTLATATKTTTDMDTATTTTTVVEPAPEAVLEQAPEAVLEPAPEVVLEPAPEVVLEPASEPVPEPAAPPPPTAAAAAIATAIAIATTTLANSSNGADSSAPQERDVVIGEGSADQKTNLLLLDIIRLHRVVYALRLTESNSDETTAADDDSTKGKEKDGEVSKLDDASKDKEKEEEVNKQLDDTVKEKQKEEVVKEETVNKVVDRLIKLIRKGKDYELAGWKEVPKSFMKSTGRFLRKEGDSWNEMSDEDVKEEVTKLVKAEFDSDVENTAESPYKEFKEILLRKKSVEDAPIGTPEAKDVILLHCEGPETDKIFDQQSSNKAIFNLASQLVTSYTNSPEKRVEAALTILQGIDQAEILMDPNDGDKDSPASAPTSKVARFLVRASGDEGTSATAIWSVLDTVDAIEFVTTFVFEVYLEKEIHVAAALAAAAESGPGADTSGPGTDPIPEPTDHDVLFGRGGMTNSHVGNRRFRDVITLHRPDYIRAIKMDKPGVARKIVKAIRLGNPPGRFLRKGDDGKWYDVGDRTAAEKTSQGLRERSNVEKRQRSALREALRIRKEDMPDDDGSPASKKAKTEPGTVESAAAAAATTLNYTGTNLAIPLSLSMKEATKPPAKKKVPKDGKEIEEELNTEGLPPNATDEEGNVLVTDYDILCGRGGLTNHHKGNKRFRDVVALHRPDYVRAPKIQKPSVARVIVRAIRNGDPPGRFIRKDDKTGKWVDIGDKKAAEKTSQALREKTNEERDQLKQTPGSLGVLLPNPASFLAAATASMVTALTASKKPEEIATTTEGARADDEEEKTDDKAGVEEEKIDDKADKEGEEEKTDEPEKKDDEKEEEEEEAKEEEVKEEREPEKEPISVDGETALV